MSVEIRPASALDAPALLAIYVPFVTGTAISFETVPPDVGEFAARIAKANAKWSWLTATIDGRCVGYAYGSSHRERAAYRYSVETSVYVHPDFQRRGVARALYARLLAALSERGYCNAFAGIALPNEASVALHRSLGFASVGTFQRVGRKFDVWHDVSWWQYLLQDEPLTGNVGLPRT